MRVVYRHALLVLASMSALLLVHCGSASTPFTTAPITIQVVHGSFLNDAPFFIAQDEGFFKAEGLAIQEQTLPVPMQALPNLVQGQVDVLMGIVSTGMLKAMSAGAGVQIVADRGSFDPKGCTYTALVARKALVDSGQLASPGQLEGKNIEVNPALFEGFYTATFLQSAGLSFGDVHLSNLDDAVVMDALSSGTIDVTATSEPWVTRIVQAGSGVIWKPAQELVPNFQFGVMLYGPTLLQKSPDAGKRFMRAYLKGVAQFNQGKTPRNLEILAAHIKLDAPLLAKTCFPSIRADGQINLSSVMDYQAWTIKQGQLDQPATAEQIWNPTIAQAAAKDLGVSP
jgi:NitT/TauT family transport system substrate-binding protein